MITIDTLQDMKQRIAECAEDTDDFDKLLNLKVVSKLVDSAIGAAILEGEIEEHQEVLERLFQIVDDAINEE